MGKTAFLIGVCFALLGSSARADQWMSPEPIGFHSRGFGYVAEIFPARSRQNAGDRPLCYFYEVGYPGMDWQIDARLKWTAPLVNDRMPYQALISQQGDLVTLNEHGSVGYRNAVVIYDKSGSLVRAYELEELLSPAEISTNENQGKIDISTSSRWWNRDAKYYFLTEPARLYIVLPWGTALELFLNDGKHAYRAATDFPELAAVRLNAFANEETEIWVASLRFSSITDVLAARAGSH